MTDPVMKCRSAQFDPIFGATRFTVGAFGNTSRKAATISCGVPQLTLEVDLDTSRFRIGKTICEAWKE